jgi:outer membrane autotransporter protein
VDGFSLLTGLAWGQDLSPGRLTLGAFFEYGYGNYDTHNSFSNAASVRGDGDTDYVGGGLLGRFDFAPTGPGNFHLEASGRAGQVDNEYDSSDLRLNGRKAEYETSSAYYGFHFGAGYTWKITEAASLDLYGKYFWTRQEGDSLRLPTDVPLKFKDADSSRLRGGARLAYALNEYVRPYIGAAYEHEFDGEAEATALGYGIKAPKLEGGTGIGELGLSLTPSASLPLSFDLGVQGYTGTREGVTGSLHLRFEF